MKKAAFAALASLFLTFLNAFGQQPASSSPDGRSGMSNVFPPPLKSVYCGILDYDATASPIPIATGQNEGGQGQPVARALPSLSSDPAAGGAALRSSSEPHQAGSAWPKLPASLSTQRIKSGLKNSDGAPDATRPLCNKECLTGSAIAVDKPSCPKALGGLALAGMEYAEGPSPELKGSAINCTGPRPGVDPPDVDVCDHLGRGLQFSAGLEPLLWWQKSPSLPSLFVTTGSTSDAQPGVLGQPKTSVLLGHDDLDYGVFGGFRGSLGMWFDPEQFLGVETSAFFLGEGGSSFRVSSNSSGSPLLALTDYSPSGVVGAYAIATPSAQGTRQAAPGGAAPIVIGGQLVAGNGSIISASPASPSLSGGISIHSDSQLWGTDTNFLHAFVWTPDFHLVALAGIRYLDLGESLGIGTERTGNGTSALTFQGSDVASQGIVLTDDSFHTRNQFLGGQLGLRGEYVFDRFFVGMSTLLALGGTEEVANVSGSSVLLPKTGSPTVVAGGLYGLPSNSGKFHSDEFGIIPELQVKGGWIVTSWCRLSLGYDFLYWNSVLRPGDQIDLIVDGRQVPTSEAYKANSMATVPQPVLAHSSFWAQGLTFSVEFTY